jgi:zinc transporter ZupT
MEISPFLWSLLWNIFLWIGIAITIYITKIFKNKFISLLDYFTSITVWLLIWIIFLWFLPEIVNESNIEIKSISIFILIWLFLFYVLELFLHWHHCRDLYHNDCSHSHIDEHNSWSLMFVWTLIHNIFHWIELFILFSIDVNYWIFTTFAIFLHAVPQNIANYIMNHKNIKYSYIASFWGIIWAILTYPFYDFLVKYNFEILSIIAWWLLYIALTDIFPNIKQKGDMKHKIIYLFFMIFWIFIFYFFNNLVH